MANKFLPFIVDKSTPAHIYQTLLSRSKGMNTNLITSIFHTVLVNGIKEVRNYVKSLPDMPLEKVYEELTVHYQKDKITDEELQLFLNLELHLTPEDSNRWVDELDEFTLKDVLAFFLVMAKIGAITDVTEMDFNSLYLQGTRENILKNIPDYVNFSDAAPAKLFSSPWDLQAYILYHTFLSPEGEDTPTVCATFSVGED